MKAIQIISQDLFDKVRSRFSNLEMGNETGAVTIDPSEARFFDFDFVIEGNNLGRVSISLNELGSLKVYYSQGITENQDDIAKQEWYKFLKEMRFFSMRRLLRFDTRDIAKTNLDKNDFQHLAKTQAPKELNMPETTNESRWNQKSTKKTSRAVRGATEVIVRHAHPVDEEYAGSRSQRKNIKAIFIQNSDGERYKYPFIHPAGAFAMAQHVDHGGVPHDPAGKAIIKMSEQIAQLQEFQRQVQHTSLHDDAMGITERAVGRLQELKAKIEALGKRHHYEAWVAEVNETETPMLSELDPVTLETYKQKFTQTNFKEELANYFPLIHSIMQETNTVDLEEYVSEESDICPDCKEDPCVCGSRVKEDAFSKFEEWADATEQGKLADDEIEDLKQAITDTQELKLGPDGQTAWQFFNNFGLDDSDLKDKFKAAAEVDPETDPMEVFKLWADESYPELTVALGMSDTAAPAEEPAAAPAEPAPEEQPVVEGQDIIINGKQVNTRSLEVDGIDTRDYPDFSDAYFSYGEFVDGSEMSDNELEQLSDEHGDLLHELVFDRLHENNDQSEVGNDPTDTKGEHDRGYGDASRGVNKNPYNPGSPSHGAYGKGQQAYSRSFGENEEMKGGKGTMSRESIVKEVAKIVKSFYNADNPSVGPFRGAENIALDCKKQVAEKFGDKAGEFAEGLAGQFIEKLTNEWQQKHGNVGDDGLARLKELVGNIKSKVEGRESHQAKTTMKHVDASNASDSEKAAIRQASKDIKPGVKGYADRADALKAAGVPDDRGANESGPNKSDIPAFMRKQQGGDWKMSTKDLEKEKTNSPTSSAGLARKKAELGISEELAAIMKLSGLAK